MHQPARFAPNFFVGAPDLLRAGALPADLELWPRVAEAADLSAHDSLARADWPRQDRIRPCYRRKPNTKASEPLSAEAAAPAGQAAKERVRASVAVAVSLGVELSPVLAEAPVEVVFGAEVSSPLAVAEAEVGFDSEAGFRPASAAAEAAFALGEEKEFRLSELKENAAPLEQAVVARLDAHDNSRFFGL